ncbi:hypothetical protein CLAFUW4_03256 [Fulvia fulva]|uniref:F-box domain-containing protein n=1 Tax=Passalora fulva TaxID=5499 RepID=A0A9Q8LBB5_PASFU|nr:uncharacterized protein CLAFUR5_03239 [Fulvia fulva]KAK4631453.1 hypothetical protein CLAFUR4_03245 [Fulvia fulva]KAK4632640.1 hypothetical protein CLAFUR0_03249 [Fulvia fulva]UJO14254.1 hypothetical protein CLAFUR5_03239 [Fulvia fulva]WPV12018.1 hypothetical protein CLAFUW4_03256 [Fulvia fulva]WPV25570.1 hypothetical protein CLAFUW7_03249 [Fulvia fulva]
MLSIIDWLPPEGFINFVFANYPLLVFYGQAPGLSQPRITYITTQTQLPAMFPLLQMPAEINLQIMSHLSPFDTMVFVLSNYQVLARQGIAPSLTSETVSQLRNALRSRRNTPPDRDGRGHAQEWALTRPHAANMPISNAGLTT